LEMPLINYGINIIEFSNMSKNIANYHHIKWIFKVKLIYN
jgi:hypothetical protein